VRASCPCYAPGSASNTYRCGVDPAAGHNPTVAEWQPIFALVAGGPSAWGSAGPSVASLVEGCGHPMPRTSVPATFPEELLEAIAMNESSWEQFCVPTTPADEAGPPERTIISFDCGYGVGQITSGMHVGETPSWDRARVAAEPAYNLATGTLILAGKWRALSCVGDQRPAIVEDWYLATWAYNGLSFSNNPNNPNYDAHRPVCDPNLGCPNRPYQERVWGWMEHPPTAAHWTPIQPAYPDPADIPLTGATVPALPEPSCAGPTDCTERRTVHLSASAAPRDAGADFAGGRGDGGRGDGAGSSDGDVGPAGDEPAGCACTLHGCDRLPHLASLLLAGLLVATLTRRRASNRR
jgi:hypothetical protein